jgi:hypothetical protein
MSSTYGLICLNHDPAIEFGEHEHCYDRDVMLTAARYPGDYDWTSAHARCDLLVARYDPILEIGCPGTLGLGRDSGCRWHEKPFWADADWIRLLAAAYQAGDAIPANVFEPFNSRCWKRERVLRLRPLLGVRLTAVIPDEVPIRA